MKNQTFIINGKRTGSEEVNFKQLVSEAYRMKVRPLCACKSPPMPMYVSRVGAEFVIKRMPNSGARHHPECPSYEIPSELSGLGQVAGAAIKEDLKQGVISLSLGFSLSKMPTRTAPIPGEVEQNSVESDGTKLTMRGLLHYLWGESGLNVWHPNMYGKRNWFIVRRELMRASKNNIAKKMSLDSILFIPENFKLDEKENIDKRRKAALKHLYTTKPAKPLMMLLGEVKEINRSTYGFKLVVKHLPNFQFMLDEVIYKRLLKRFALELEFSQVEERSHLIVLATFGLTAAGYAAVEEMTLMIVDENWLPFESIDEKELLSKLVASNYRFTKALRYNLPRTTPLASVVIISENPTVCYISGASSTDGYREDLLNLMENSELPSWYWDVSVDVMPELPNF